MVKEVIKKIREILKEKLEKKTGWGKNEVMTLFNEAVADALLEIANEKDNNGTAADSSD